MFIVLYIYIKDVPIQNRTIYDTILWSVAEHMNKETCI